MNKQTVLSAFAIAGMTAALSASAMAKEPLSLSDVDGDGVISAEEIRSQVETQRAARIALFDTDGDGALSDAEKDAMREARHAERLAAADTDGNGKVSRAEKRASREARYDAIEAQLDVNGDGVVSDAEGAGFDEVRDELRGKRGRGHAHQDRADARQDGVQRIEN